jgi:hypothetical protein
MKITYDVDFPAELGAGIRGFTETITVEVESGDPGGEEGEFAVWMRQAINEWYDGARVIIRAEMQPTDICPVCGVVDQEPFGPDGHHMGKLCPTLNP